MTTLLFLFLISLGLALVLTPLATRLGVRLGAVDMPSARNVHTTPIPRVGGLAVFLSFAATIVLAHLYVTNVSMLLVHDRRAAFVFAGAMTVFGCGLWDDFRRLSPSVKLLFQILGASLAFAGGISIGGFFIGGYGIQFGILSYAVTVFWFLLFINAVNLIDGLDGLAAGVIFFTCLLMIILSVMRADYLEAIYFSALGGAVLGFLRYNFNPASVFLGDGGSYFLGYSVAALSIMGSVKSQVGALMLIPLLALGVPVIPSKTFEAAAMQKPILLGVEGLAREIVENHAAGICFEPEHEGDFLQKVSLLKEDRNMYQKLQEGCVRLAHAYDRKSLAKLMLDHLKNVSSTR